jgi:sporulation protein YlmC with PRC-barrel domain
MSREPAVGRAGEVLGRPVRDRSGRPIGRIADLVTDNDNRVVAAIVVRGRWGRLLGYERDESIGPRLLEYVARRAWRRNAVEIPWAELR